MINSIKSYLHSCFPAVTDWSSEQTEMRFNKNVQDMPFSEWFFFHYTAYPIILYSFHILSILIFAGIGLFFWITNVFPNLIAFIFMLASVYFIVKFVSWLKYYYSSISIGKYTTLYDVLMREYHE